jgi:hypothetical protein
MFVASLSTERGNIAGRYVRLIKDSTVVPAVPVIEQLSAEIPPPSNATTTTKPNVKKISITFTYSRFIIGRHATVPTTTDKTIAIPTQVNAAARTVKYISVLLMGRLI